MTETTPNLEDVLADCAPAAVAVSGGVDSMTLAYVAHRVLRRNVTMFHAVSAAVPPVATERVRRYADVEGWRLTVLDAGEFGDERYMQNPANRCFFCKSNLYGTLSRKTSGQLLSGTNMDDLGDWRPGLQAAKDRDVRHPFVEAGLTKSDVRALARHHGLDDLAELPSAPCLSSRIETGIRINADTLRAIDRTETLLRDTLTPQTARCRVRGSGIVIELDTDCLNGLDADRQASLVNDIRQFFSAQSASTIEFAPYQRGSTFLTETLND